MEDFRAAVIANVDSCIATLEEGIAQRLIELADVYGGVSTPEEVIAQDEELQWMREALECLMALRKKIIAGGTR